MNKIDFQQTGGFPLDTDVLDFMQKSYHLLQVLGEMAGNYAILQGCVQSGSTVSDGVVYLNGEVLPFKGGTVSGVIIRSAKSNLQFEDGTTKPVEETRYATFGIGAVEWKKFSRVDNLQELMEKKAEEVNLKKLEDKFNELEKRVAKMVPIGLVAIWDRPAEQIPTGWVEHTELRGRTPVGCNKYDSDFSRLGREFGEKKHRLSVDEMPAHSHKMYGRKTRDDEGYGSDGSEYSTPNNSSDTISPILPAGGGEPHNNMQPSRIVRFIRFVGQIK